MRIETVLAESFGPFHEQELSLAPGMNVVYGPNEAGKSSWFGALRAGLCGIRRSRGKPRKDDKEFRDKHKPWHRRGWKAGVRIQLDDSGRRELTHDLVKGTAQLKDVESGKKLSARDLENEGCIDGSLLLGLDRNAALSTMFVAQGDVLRVLEEAKGLQQFLQRAATSHATDTTAEQALDRLSEVHRERVGSERAPKRPLVTATLQLERAKAAADQARDDRDQLQDLLVKRRSEQHRLEEIESQIGELRSAQEWTKVDELEQRVGKARSLKEQLAESRRNPGVDENRILEVERALASWEARKELPDLPEGESATELRAQLQRLAAPSPAGRAADSPPSAPPAPPTRASTPAPSRGLLPLGIVSVAVGAALLTLTDFRIGGAAAAGFGLLLTAIALLRRSGQRAPSAPAPAAPAEPDVAALQARLEAEQGEVRRQLEQRLTTRVEQEEHHARASAERSASLERIQELSRTLGLAGTDETAPAELEAWLSSQSEARSQQNELEALEARLDEILRGSTLDQLERDLRVAAERAGERPAARCENILERLEELERQRDALAERAAALSGQVEQRRNGLPSVAEALERESSAERRLAGIRALDRALTLAQNALRQAKASVNATLAPVLTQRMRPWLPRITEGRYSDLRIDPDTLAVQVQEPGGAFRDATVLSHGTMEQVYLLLRLALAEFLALREETLPIVLDDVTVQSDSSRTIAFLELLHEISRERQVVVFSQEQEVFEWARSRLTEGQSSRLIEVGAT